MCSFTFGSPVYVRKAKNVLLMFYIQFRASWRALVRYYCSHLRQWLACCPCKLAFEEHCSCTDPGRCEPSGQWPHHQTSLGLGCCNKAGHDACSLSQARAGSSLKWSAMRRKKMMFFVFSQNKAKHSEWDMLSFHMFYLDDDQFVFGTVVIMQLFSKTQSHCWIRSRNLTLLVQL